MINCGSNRIFSNNRCVPDPNPAVTTIITSVMSTNHGSQTSQLNPSPQMNPSPQLNPSSQGTNQAGVAQPIQTLAQTPDQISAQAHAQAHAQAIQSQVMTGFQNNLGAVQDVSPLQQNGQPIQSSPIDNKNISLVPVNVIG